MIDFANPAWWALGLSIVSGFFSIVAIVYNRRGTKASIDQALIRQRNDINDAIVRNLMKGPYATILNIPERPLLPLSLE